MVPGLLPDSPLETSTDRDATAQQHGAAPLFAPVSEIRAPVPRHAPRAVIERLLVGNIDYRAARFGFDLTFGLIKPIGCFILVVPGLVDVD
jgi:hypothetical protein